MRLLKASIGLITVGDSAQTDLDTAFLKTQELRLFNFFKPNRHCLEQGAHAECDNLVRWWCVGNFAA